MKVIADCCNNHDGSMFKIGLMINQLAELGIDYVKFQVFTADKLSPTYPNYDEMYKVYKRCELSEDMIKEIVAFSGKRIKPLFTLFDVDKADMLRKYTDIVKIASPDLTNCKLLDVVFKKFKKVIISTGMSTMIEIERTLKKYLRYRRKIILLYCKSQYPAVYTREDEIKYGLTKQLAEKHEIEFGFSDHCNELITKPVDWYEHHFTLEKTGKQDDAVSWDIKEFANLLGLQGEYENRIKYRKRWL
jgi:N,N'-diacetyllegionaminate synthase